MKIDRLRKDRKDRKRRRAGRSIAAVGRAIPAIRAADRAGKEQKIGTVLLSSERVHR